MFQHALNLYTTFGFMMFNETTPKILHKTRNQTTSHKCKEEEKTIPVQPKTLLQKRPG